MICRLHILVNFYKAKDNKWLFIVCLPDEQYWPTICKALKLEQVENDPMFSTREKRLENNSDLISIMDKAILSKTRNEWGKIFDDQGIVWSSIPSCFEEVAKDPQVLANDHIVEVDHPSYGPVKIVTTPIRLNKKAPEIRRLAPEIGEHNEEILLKLNYTWDDIVKFKENGVIP